MNFSNYKNTNTEKTFSKLMLLVFSEMYLGLSSSSNITEKLAGLSRNMK